MITYFFRYQIHYSCSNAGLIITLITININLDQITGWNCWPTITINLALTNALDIAG